jgi:hypothetical protein
MPPFLPWATAAEPLASESQALYQWDCTLDNCNFRYFQRQNNRTLVMSRVWSIITKDKNRQTISWIGGALVAIAGGAWTVVAHVWPGQEASSPKIVCAQQGSIAAGHDVSGSTINYAVGAPTSLASGVTTCTSVNGK